MLLMQGQDRAGMAHLTGRNDTGRGDLHRMQLALQAAVPKLQKFAQDGEFGGQVVILPSVALQQAGMVGQVIEDLGGRQTIAVQLTDQAGHTRFPIESVTPVRKYGRPFPDPKQKKYIFHWVSRREGRWLP